jgi:hypothetical protein
MSSRWNHRQRIGTASLMAGAMALLVQVIAWAWLPAWIAAENGGLDQQVIVCTAHGPKVLALSDLGDGGQEDLPESHQACPLCSLVYGLALVSPVPSLPSRKIVHVTPVTRPSETIVTAWILTDINTRAPPVFG